MARFTAVTGLAALALALPGPAEGESSTRHASVSTVSPSVLEHTGEVLETTRRSASDRSPGALLRASLDPDRRQQMRRIIVFPDDRAHRLRVARAVERYDREGLVLPDLQVVFSESDDTCRGHFGLFDRSETPWHVKVCSELEFVLTHELSHAWVAANLDEGEKAAYTAYRGLSAWNDPELPWQARGTEDAAFVMQQVLMAERLPPRSPVWIERIAAFEQLTGRTPTVAMVVAERGR